MPSRPFSLHSACASALALAGLFLLAPAEAQTATHGLLLLGNSVYGWGDNSYAQLDAALPAHVDAPVELRHDASPGWRLAAGARHSLALDAKGQVWAWGDNSSGQLGVGSTRPVPQPTQVLGLPAKAQAIAGGTQHSLAVLEDGSVWAWGSNQHGQLGSGAKGAFALGVAPTQVPGLPAPAEAISAGSDFSMARLRDGSTWAWGGDYGAPQLLQTPTLQGWTLPEPPRLLLRGHVHPSEPGLRLSTSHGAQCGPILRKGDFVCRVPFGWSGSLTLLRGSLAAAPYSVSALHESTSLSLSPPATSSATTTTAAAPASPRTPAPGTPVAAPAATAPSTHAPAASAVAAPAAPAPVPASTPAATLSVPATPPAAPEPAHDLHLSGTVALSSGFGAGIGEGAKRLENASVSAEGAQCSATDAQGRYSCVVPYGWSGSVHVRKPNYRFSPSSLSYQNLRTTATQQDFSAVYDPR